MRKIVKCGWRFKVIFLRVQGALILNFYKHHLEPVHSAVEGEVLAGGDQHYGVVQLLVQERGPGPWPRPAPVTLGGALGQNEEQAQQLRPHFSRSFLIEISLNCSLKSLKLLKEDIVGSWKVIFNKLMYIFLILNILSVFKVCLFANVDEL